MKQLTNLKFMAMALFVAMLSMSFTACSDDDDDDVNYAESVVGTWQMGSAKQGFAHVYKFNSNETGEEKNILYNDNGQETFNNTEQISYSYSYDNSTGFGTLYISNDLGARSYKVKRFSDKLHIYTESNKYNEYIKK